MAKITCTRRLFFEAGHRLLGHEGKCQHIHGHNYEALITAEAEGLDEIGRVIDFDVLKNKVGDYLNTYWDHQFLVFDEDVDTMAALRIWEHRVGRLTVVVVPFNPTAENMANHILTSICPYVLKGTGVRVTKVRLWETRNCYADATL